VNAVVRGWLRFRPIVVSGIVAVIGFVPAAIFHGAEIQRPLARVVVVGLISSTLLTLPVVCALIAERFGFERLHLFSAGEAPPTGQVGLP
jgi:Cu/Ag efflux pump CusA